MLATNDVALKEWAVVCDALGSGRYTVLLRKGGIREPRNGFSVRHGEFFLFPTYVHENAEELAAAVRETLPIVAGKAAAAGTLPLTLYVSVEHVSAVETLDALRGLDGHHALAWRAVERRFHYRRPGLHVMALRVYRLRQPIVVPHLPRYDGCRSWVTLESALPVGDLEPVLDDRTFGRRLSAVREALAGPAASVPSRDA